MSLLKKISSNFDNPYRGPSEPTDPNNEKSKNENLSFSEQENKKTKFNPAAETASTTSTSANPAASGELGHNEKKGDDGPALPPPIPCLFCGIGVLWLDFNNNVHCYKCEPPPSQSMIRGRWVLEDNDEPATWIDRGTPGRAERAKSADQQRQAATGTTKRGASPAAAATLDRSERPERPEQFDSWIETFEEDSAGRLIKFLRPPQLAARGPVMGYGYSSFDRDPSDTEGKRIVFSGMQWFDW